MNARYGDRITVTTKRRGRGDRCGKIVAVHGPNGSPPYVVRWDDTGQITLLFPDSDARLEASVAEPIRRSS